MRGDSIESLVTHADFLYGSYYEIVEDAKEELTGNDIDSDKVTALLGWVNEFGFIITELVRLDFEDASSVQNIYKYIKEEKRKVVEGTGDEYVDIIIHCLEKEISEMRDNLKHLLNFDPATVMADNYLIPRDGIQHLLREVPEDRLPNDIKNDIIELDRDIRTRFNERDLSAHDVDFLSYVYYPPEFWWRHPRYIDDGIEKLGEKYDWYPSSLEPR